MTATLNASTSTGVVLTSDTSGNLDIQSNGVSKLSVTASGVGIPAYNPSASLITAKTTVASTSGTSIDFTGIPSWAKRITVMFSNVSTNGSSIVQIQVGSGSFVTSGYVCIASGFSSTNAVTLAFTAGIATGDSGNASFNRYGNVYLTTLGSNIWTADGGLALNNLGKHICSGGVTLSGALDRVRITTINGTDVFDAGSINILYE